VLAAQQAEHQKEQLVLILYLAPTHQMEVAVVVVIKPQLQLKVMELLVALAVVVVVMTHQRLEAAGLEIHHQLLQAKETTEEPVAHSLEVIILAVAVVAQAQTDQTAQGRVEIRLREETEETVLLPLLRGHR
jgi:hypothetical protein